MVELSGKIDQIHALASALISLGKDAVAEIILEVLHSTESMIENGMDKWDTQSSELLENILNLVTRYCPDELAEIHYQEMLDAQASEMEPDEEDRFGGLGSLFG